MKASFSFEYVRLVFMLAIVAALYSRIAPPDDKLLKRALIVAFIVVVFEVIRIGVKIIKEK